MNNQYANNPFILQGQQPQDLSGLSPVFQNIAGQQAAQNAALAQQNQLVQQAGQTGQGGMNPMAMAQMLRGRFGGARPQMPTPFAGINSMPRPPMMGVSGMGDAMGTGINPNAGDIYGGVNPLANRQAFLNFINSLNRG